MASYVKTKGGINLLLIVGGKPENIALHNTEEHYDQIIQAIKDGKSDSEIYGILKEKELKLKQAAQVTDKIKVEGGEVFFEGDKVDGYLVTSMLNMIAEGFDIKPMALFLTRLSENPSSRVYGELYEFLEKGGIPLTEDGCFLAYRKVNKEFYDIHSRSVLNKPADLMDDRDLEVIQHKMGNRGEATVEIIDGITTISMPRRMVNDNSNETCSHGFHAASYEYMQHFGADASGDIIIICKIDPKDVVSIPRDYNASKMRICRYQVLHVLEDGSRDILRETTVSGEVADLNDTFHLVGTLADGSTKIITTANVLRSLFGDYDQYEGVDEEYGFVKVSIVNTKTGVVAMSKELEVEKAPVTAADDVDEFRVIQDGDVLDTFDNESDAVLAAMGYDRSAGEVTVVDSNDDVVATFS